MINPTRTAPGKAKVASPMKTTVEKSAPDVRASLTKPVAKPAAAAGGAIAAVAPAKSHTKSSSVVPMDYETFLSKLGPRDRLNVERHVTAAEAEPDPGHVNLWKRLASYLMTLAPHAPKTTGQQAVQFFIPDGKYRMQVMALQDQADEKIVIYVSTTLDAVFAANIISGPRLAPGDGVSYPITGATGQLLTVEELDGKSADPAPFYKDMLGWNRKALRLTLLTTASPQQASAVEAICSMASHKWK